MIYYYYQFLCVCFLIRLFTFGLKEVPFSLSALQPIYHIHHLTMLLSAI